MLSPAARDDGNVNWARDAIGHNIQRSWARLPRRPRCLSEREGFCGPLHRIVNDSAPGTGGGSGIRTRDGVAPIHALQACAFNRSATPPYRPPYWRSRRRRLGHITHKPVGATRRRLGPFPRIGDQASVAAQYVAKGHNGTSGHGLALALASLAMMGGRLPPLGALVECAQHCERHRGDAGLDGRLRHRREQR